jgi:hypothetical protein
MSINIVSNYVPGSERPIKTEQVKGSHDKKLKNESLQQKAVDYQRDYEVQTEDLKRRNAITVERLKEEALKREESLRELVKKMLVKQGQAFDNSMNIYEILREGKLDVDEETRVKAQKDISKDGYWGVEQTSERLVSFAKALADNDPAKADEMIEAIKKGFEEATKIWGGQLPDICKETIDTTISKLEEWRNSSYDEKQ